MSADFSLNRLELVLYQPEIPPNTGNIARLCAATNTCLHLIEPLGFSLSDRYLKRAGLDYWEHVRLTVWPDFESYLQKNGANKRLVTASSRQGETFHTFPFLPDDAIVLGPETKGLPQEIFNMTRHRLRIPITDNVRSLNLSTAAGILLYQALASTGQLI